MTPPTLRTVTLGCKVNQYETAWLREGFLRLGYRDARDGEAADLCVVNTCTVTAEGDLKSRKLVRRLARRNPAAEIVVMGCYATRAPDEVAALPGVAEVVTDKRQLPDLLARRGLVDVPRAISSFGGRHRAYVKVQDGCRMGCSYCIIPQVRPVLSSRPGAEIVEEVRGLVAGGHREIVLTGIHLGHYGRRSASVPSARASRGESPEGGEPSAPARTRLAGLVALLAALPGQFRIRLSSLEATEVDDALLDLVASRPQRICQHLHLSMQSGSDRVLRLMRRRQSSEEFIARCRHIAHRLDRPAITTDVIVGFPGEREEDFAATCRAVEAVGFAKVHVFPFSPRQGTPAAEMPDQIAAPVRQQRAAVLAALAERQRAAFLAGLVGRRLQVLLESPAGTSGEAAEGTSSRYAPVTVPAAAAQCGELVETTAVRYEAGQLRGAPWGSER